MELVVAPSGLGKCVYGEAIDLSVLGELTIRRGSHVEPNPGGGWTADLAPVDGPILGPFSLRSEALQAEIAWLHHNWLLP